MSLLDMCPRVTHQDVAYRARGHMELSRDGGFSVFALGKQAANFFHLRLSDCCFMMALAACRAFRVGIFSRLFSTRSIATAFLEHVHKVVSICAKKEMVGPDAGAIVAMVANKQAIWDWANVELVRQAMGKDCNLGANIKNVSVPVRNLAASPLPTTIGLVYPAPEPLYHSLDRVGVIISSCVAFLASSGGLLALGYGEAIDRKRLFAVNADSCVHKKCLLLTLVSALVEGARQLTGSNGNYIRLSLNRQPLRTLDAYKYTTGGLVVQGSAN